MKIRTMLKNNRGSTIIIFSCSLAAILVLFALVTDLGYIAVERRKLINTTDAAALAGAQDLIIGKQTAVNTANSYVNKNENGLGLTQVTVSDDNTAITVKTKKFADYFFMRFAGYNSREIFAESTAVVSTICSYKGIRPFAVEKQDFIFGIEYVLKEGAGDGTTGNYGPLALGGTGTNNFRDNIIRGFQHKLKVGDLVDTETGNMKNPTRQGVEYLISQCRHIPLCTYESYSKECPRIIVIPIVDSLDLPGRKPAQIVGFASFILCDYKDNGGKSEIIGRFIKNIEVGDMKDGVQGFGTAGVRLIK